MTEEKDSIKLQEGMISINNIDKTPEECEKYKGYECIKVVIDDYKIPEFYFDFDCFGKYLSRKLQFNFAKSKYKILDVEFQNEETGNVFLNLEEYEMCGNRINNDINNEFIPNWKYKKTPDYYRELISSEMFGNFGEVFLNNCKDLLSYNKERFITIEPIKLINDEYDLFLNSSIRLKKLHEEYSDNMKLKKKLNSKELNCCCINCEYYNDYFNRCKYHGRDYIYNPNTNKWTGEIYLDQEIKSRDKFVMHPDLNCNLKIYRYVKSLCDSYETSCDKFKFSENI